jgi:Asp-tRNA(Asn)/Glu-tRNA(Gln) amidotransferase A subunit family amidase
MARRVSDVAMMFDAIAGHDPNDPTSLTDPAVSARRTACRTASSSSADGSVNRCSAGSRTPTRTQRHGTPGILPSDTLSGNTQEAMTNHQEDAWIGPRD